jgi:hypothetical protein
MALIDPFWRLVAGYGMAGGFIVLGIWAIILIWKDWHRRC